RTTLSSSSAGLESCCRISPNARKANTNRFRDRGVLPDDEWPEPMHELADELPRRLVAVDSELELEFERRVVESSTLAFRIAYGVLRRREDAEDVAQDAFAKAYRSFRQLRDRDRFRAWLVRMTWRLALDRQRSDRRRAARERSPEGLRHIAPETFVAQGFSPAAIEEIAARERAEQ